VKVYQVLLIYQYLSLSLLSLSWYQVLLQQSQEALEFFEMFLTHDPTQPTKKVKISTQPNPTRGSTQPTDNSGSSNNNNNNDNNNKGC